MGITYLTVQKLSNQFDCDKLTFKAKELILLTYGSDWSNPSLNWLKYIIMHSRYNIPAGVFCSWPLDNS